MRSGDLCLQAFLTETPVVQAGQRVNHRQFEQLLGALVLLGRDFDLLCELDLSPPKMKLLIKCVDAEQQDQTEQAANSLAFELINRAVWLRHLRDDEGSDSSSEGQDYY